ncbi:MAG: LapA family protein [bacterium]|nr:LapA family protein [bacterium]
MYIFAIVIITLFAIFGIIIGAQNTRLVELHILGKVFNPPLISVIIVSFAGGAILAFVLAIVDEIKLRGKIGKQQKEIEGLESELGALKTMSTEEEK